MSKPDLDSPEYRKLCRKGITKEIKPYYQSLIKASLTSNGEKARYPPRDTSFLNDEYLRQKSYAAPLYKSVDLDFFIAETYREYPDRERDHIARGVKELKIAEFKKFLGEFEKWGNRQR